MIANVGGIRLLAISKNLAVQKSLQRKGENDQQTGKAVRVHKSNRGYVENK